MIKSTVGPSVKTPGEEHPSKEAQNNHWNGETRGTFLLMVDTTSRYQPIRPLERLFKKRKPLGKPEDKQT